MKENPDRKKKKKKKINWKLIQLQKSKTKNFKVQFQNKGRKRHCTFFISSLVASQPPVGHF